MPTDAAWTCALCGLGWGGSPGEAGDSTWLSVEIVRADGADGLDHTSVDFCAQPHAALWWQTPLPRPTPAPTPRATWRDHLAVAAFGLGVGLVVLSVLSVLFAGWSLLRAVP